MNEFKDGMTIRCGGRHFLISDVKEETNGNINCTAECTHISPLIWILGDSWKVGDISKGFRLKGNLLHDVKIIKDVE